MSLGTLPATARDYGLTESAAVLQTSAAGDRIAGKNGISFASGIADRDTVIEVEPGVIRQTLLGIGSSFTEASAFVLAHLEPERRGEVMESIYGASGANFSLARTPIGATDFSVEGRYSYADTPGDTRLDHFSVDVDDDGFPVNRYPGICDQGFDLLPMIREALAIKGGQQDDNFRILATAWTAPPWMKDIDDWYRGPAPESGFEGTGGELRPEHYATYAEYLVRYLQAYRRRGVDIWGLTPVNEPLGNNGQWESMHFSAESQRDFIRDHLGPRLHRAGLEGVELFMLDHSRDHLHAWAGVIYGDPQCAAYLSGAAVHWYESTFRVFEEELERVHAEFPGFAILHSEGCIDDLGKDAPPGIADPQGYKESGWFDNDDFWWHDNASDWAYSATWEGVNAEDHPLYTPVHRYARNIIVSLNHWVTGWIDWNVVLDASGGPNHVGNYCGAPIMIDTETGQVYYTPVFHVLAQFSRTIRPGDRVLQTVLRRGALEADAIHACASVDAQGLLSVQILNTTQTPIDYALQIGGQHAETTIDANALQTIRVVLPADAVGMAFRD